MSDLDACVDPREVHPDEVHKSRCDNVWLHRVSEPSEHTIVATYEIPQREQFRTVRFVELMEVQRQLAMVQLHRQVGTNRDDALIIDSIGLEIVSPEVPLHSGQISGARVGSIADRRHTRSFVQYVGIEGIAGLSGVGRLDGRYIPRRLYERLRSDRQRSAVSLEGASSTVLIGGTRTPVIVDPDDPVLNDHPSDHVTAMQIVACIEAAVSRCYSGRRLTSLKLKFQDYVEGSEPSHLEIARRQPRGFCGRVEQLGASRVGFSGTADAKRERA